MTNVYKSRVRENTLTTGTGPVALGGPQFGYQSFGSAVPSGSTVEYVIEDLVNDGVWEAGIGTYVASSNTLTRDTVLESSNGGQPVGFLSGTKSVFLDLSASTIAALSAGNALSPATLVSTLASVESRILSPVGSVVGSGTGQANGTSLTFQINIITTATGAFVIPSSSIGQTIEIRNKDAVNTATIYPFLGAKIDNDAVNASVSLPPGSTVTFAVASSTQIWS